MSGLLDAISEAAEWDEQFSEGKSLSEREETGLQALEMMTRNADDLAWLKASALREQVVRLLGEPVEQLGHAQWIAYILSRLHLLENGRSKRQMDGVACAIEHGRAVDMLKRYVVTRFRIRGCENSAYSTWKGRSMKRMQSI